MINKIFLGDCLEILKEIPNNSIDMIFCDLPYGTTKNKWDKIIDLESLWKQYERIIKANGCIALTAQSPFDKILAMSNLKLFRYEWIWVKNKSTGHLNAKKMPMKSHENILIFYKKLPKYYPQKTFNHKPINAVSKKNTIKNSNYNDYIQTGTKGGDTSRFPIDTIYIPVINNDNKDKFHPTQKPVELAEYFIKTYTDIGDVVLDNCFGSGSTIIACKNLNRNFIGIEINEIYFNKFQEILYKI